MAAELEKLAVFLYFDADDMNLETCICQNVLDVTNAKLSDDVEIYIYLDRVGLDTRSEKKTEEEKSQTFDGIYTEWQNDEGKVQGGSLYGKVVKQSDGTFRVQWDTAAGLVQRDSSLPSTLGDFVEWGASQTTASHYMVWMSDHGNGIRGGFSDEAIPENCMIPVQYSKALKPYSDKLDVIVFDACLMADAEAVSELAGTAKYVVASEQLIGGTGYDYTTVFTQLSALKTRDAQAVAKTVIEGNETVKSAARTLSSLPLNDSLRTALQEFGKAALSFTENDWSVLVDVFHKTQYYYCDTYADLVELLQDPAFTEETVSGNLKDAVSSLKTAAESAVDYKKTATETVTTEHGCGVMVYTPVRQENNIKKSFAFLSMLQAGNDTPWADFLYKLYQKALAADKVYRQIPDDAYINQNPAAMEIGLPVSETGYLIHTMDDIGVFQISLTDTGLKQDCNYILNQEEWLCVFYDDTEIVSADTYNMVFTFEPYLNTAEIADNSIAINVYEAGYDENAEIYKLSGTPAAVYRNTGNSITIPVSSTEKLVYVWQIISEKAVAYSFEGIHTKPDGTVVMASFDRFDRELVSDTPMIYGHHSAEFPVTIDSNYIGALAVTADTQETVSSDWFCIGETVPHAIEITATGVSTGTLAEGALSVELWKKGETGEYYFAGTAGEDASQLGKYTFAAGISFAKDDLLKVSTSLDDGTACYYSLKYVAVQGKNTEPESQSQSGDTAVYPRGCINSTSVTAIPEKSSSYALFWTPGHDLSDIGGNTTYQLQFSADEQFSTALNIVVGNIAAKIYNVNSGVTYSWRVKTLNDNLEEEEIPWKDGSEKLSGTISAEPRQVIAQNDYVEDILLARANGTWSTGYCARHTGFCGTNWTGTQETVSISGKNKITDIFTGGGSDTAVLVLTDDANGDAVFTDDIYSALPDGMSEGSRLTNITKVYAGAGDDVVDFTSQCYSCGSGQTFEEMYLYGGAGDDVLWTADTASFLFGDAGNDKLTGSMKDDVLAGGSGNDVMCGGGGIDIFCFCNDWGRDIVNQISGSSVVLWFVDGDATHWNAEDLTYEDGSNTVKVSGVANEDITLLFGEASESKFSAYYETLVRTLAFEPEASTKIYTGTIA